MLSRSTTLFDHFSPKSHALQLSAAADPEPESTFSDNLSKEKLSFRTKAIAPFPGFLLVPSNRSTQRATHPFNTSEE